MADAPELNFGQMLQSDPEYLDMQQRKLIAEAMLKNTMGAQPGGGANFPRSPVAAIADFMAMKGQKDKIQSVSAEERALLGRHKDAEAAGVREFLDAISQPGADPRPAVMKAMSSQYPNLKKLGESVFKSNQENFGKVVSSMPNKLDPQSAISAAANGGYSGGLQTAPLLAPPQLMQGTTPEGRSVPWVQTGKPDGGYDVHMAPQLPSTNTLSVGEKKPGWEAIDQSGKYFADGGKGAELGDKIRGNMNSTMEILNSLTGNPQLGAGAEGFQTLRKWAEAFKPGITQGLSGNVDQLKAQLSANVIKELGGLGNQVSNQDVEFMKSAMGSIETDPNALRRIMLISLKYQMKGMAKLEDRRKTVQEMPSFKDQGATFPEQTFNVNVPDQFSQEFGNYMSSGRMQMAPTLTPNAGDRIRKRP